MKKYEIRSYIFLIYEDFYDMKYVCYFGMLRIPARICPWADLRLSESWAKLLEFEFKEVDADNREDKRECAIRRNGGDIRRNNGYNNEEISGTKKERRVYKNDSKKGRRGGR